MHMANLLGIDTNRVISFTFVLGAMLAAVGGVLIAITIGKAESVHRLPGGHQGVHRRGAGRHRQHSGAMLGGVLAWLKPSRPPTSHHQYKDIVAFALLVLILLFRPTGLLGKPEVEKSDDPTKSSQKNADPRS